jgi:hypothetical protein
MVMARRCSSGRWSLNRALPASFGLRSPLPEARVKNTARFTVVNRGYRPNRAGPVPVRYFPNSNLKFEKKILKKFLKIVYDL